MTTITDKNERAMREGMVAKTATPNLPVSYTHLTLPTKRIV